METAFFYCRKSTDETTHQKNSLEFQEDELRKFFAGKFSEEKWISVSESAVKPLVCSGKNFKSGRKGFFDMVFEMENLLKKGKKAVLLAYDMTRIARNMQDFLLLYELRKIGLTIQTPTYAFHPILNPWDDNFWLWQVETTMAIAEAGRSKKRQNSGYKKNVEKGRWAFGVPPGFLRGEKGGLKRGEVAICPKKRLGVEELFEDFLHFRGGLAAFSEARKNYYLEAWGFQISRSYLQKILRNKMYIGILEYEEKEYPSAFGAIFDTKKKRSIWDGVQEKLDGGFREKKQVHDFHFSKKIICKCGRALIGEKQKGFVYYRCHNEKCDYTTLREDRLAKKVSDFFSGKKFSAESLAKISALLDDALGGIFEMEKKRTENVLGVKKKLEKELGEIFSMRRKNLISDDDFLKQKALLENEIQKMQVDFLDTDFLEKLDVLKKILELLESGFGSDEMAKSEKVVWCVDFLCSNFFITKEKALGIGLLSFLEWENLSIVPDGATGRTHLENFIDFFALRSSAFCAFAVRFDDFLKEKKKNRKYQTEEMKALARIFSV